MSGASPFDDVKVVTFDAGNTLIRPHPSLGAVYRNVSLEFGADVPEEEFMRAIRPIFASYLGERGRVEGSGSDDRDRALWRKITGELHRALAGLASVEFEPWFERLYHVFGSGETWRYFDGVEEVLSELKYLGFKLGIVSNWDRRLRRILRELGLWRYLHATAISSEIGARKPSPEMFEWVRKDLDYAPEACLHVGDLLEEDVEGALRAGWRAVLLDREAAHEPPPDGRYRVVRSLSELVALLPDPHQHR